MAAIPKQIKVVNIGVSSPGQLRGGSLRAGSADPAPGAPAQANLRGYLIVAGRGTFPQWSDAGLATQANATTAYRTGPAFNCDTASLERGQICSLTGQLTIEANPLSFYNRHQNLAPRYTTVPSEEANFARVLLVRSFGVQGHADEAFGVQGIDGRRCAAWGGLRCAVVQADQLEEGFEEPGVAQAG